MMADTRTLEEKGRDLGVTRQAAHIGQQRAVESFVKYMGGKSALAEKLREFLTVAEHHDGLARVKFLPRYVHG